jgi:hypothetical protein
MSSRRSEQQREVAEFFLGLIPLSLLLAALWLFQGCSSGIPRHAQCDEAKVAAFVARCKLQVEMLCDKDPSVSCPVEEVCDAELQELCPKAVQ